MYILPLAALVPIVKNAGARGSTFTVTAALVRPLLVVWICAGPGGHVGRNQKVHLRIAHEAYRNRRAVDRDAHTVDFEWAACCR